MPGPLVHRASARQMAKMLKGTLDVCVLPTAYMGPDIERQRTPGAHPGYDGVAMRGSAVDAVVRAIPKMRKLLKAGKRGQAGELAQSVQHIICDMHMVTQIVPGLMEHDMMIDGLAEFVGGKDGACHGDMPDMTQDIEEELKQSIAQTVELYAKAFSKGRVGFVVRYLGPMTRRCVERGAYFGAWVVKLANGKA